MEIFTSTQLVVPMFQVILLLILSTIALLISRLRLALFINYCFTLYWATLPTWAFSPPRRRRK